MKKVYEVVFTEHEALLYSNIKKAYERVVTECLKYNVRPVKYSTVALAIQETGYYDVSRVPGLVEIRRRVIL